MNFTRIDIFIMIPIVAIWCGIVKIKNGTFDISNSYHSSIIYILLSSFADNNNGSYIIDLEDAYHINETEKPCKFTLAFDFYHWDLAGPQISISSGGIDPMAPSVTNSDKDLDEEALLKLATNATGKEIRFP